MLREVLWECLSDPVEYSQAVRLMQHYAEDLKNGSAQQRVILLQHNKVYTSPRALQTKTIGGIKLEQTNRGGEITYHGPGQRIIYPILDLRRYKMDLHWYISALEKWIVTSLTNLNVPAFSKETLRGIWLQHDSQIAKVGFIGIRVQSWITLHGCAVNITNSIKHFSNIKPCGIKDCKVTSCKEAGCCISLKDFDLSLMQSFSSFF